MFVFFQAHRDCLAPHFSNNNYHPKNNIVENSVFSDLGSVNLAYSRKNTLQGLECCKEPWELVSNSFLNTTNSDITGLTGMSEKVFPNDSVLHGTIVSCDSSTDLYQYQSETYDLVITDPPFSGLLYYAELADFFYVWLRLVLKDKYPQQFTAEYTPKALEAIANPASHPDDAEMFYKRVLTECWRESYRLLKAGGILSFTFHHSEDEPWVDVLESLFEAGFYLEATYPIRSDERLKQYESIGERTLAVETLKNMFELQHEYPRFPNFNQRVIEPAIEDINRHSDLDIRAVEKIKEGRAVTALRFKFSTKSEAQLMAAREADRFPKTPQLQLVFPELPETAVEEPPAQHPYEPLAEKDRLFQHFYPEVVEKLGVTPSAFLELLHVHSEVQVEQAIRVTRRAQTAGQIKVSPAGFFVQALKNGFTDKQEETVKKQKSAAENAAAQLHRLWEQLDALETERRAAANEVIRELTQTDPFLAGEAVGKIMLNNPVRQSLETQTGLTLDAKLPMDTWRENKPMREAVIRQIEAMRPEAFKGVKAMFDAPLLKIRQALEALQREYGRGTVSVIHAGLHRVNR